MNPNELCDILLVIMGVCLIFFISTRKQKELFNICPVKPKKKIKKNKKKKLKVKSFNKTLSNNSNISKAFLSKKEIKNTVNDQNVIINELNNLDNTSIDNSNVDDSNKNYNGDLSDVNNFDNLYNEFTTFDNLDNENNLENNKVDLNENNLENEGDLNENNLENEGNLDELSNDLQSNNNLVLNDLGNDLQDDKKDNNFNNIYNKKCDREIKGIDKEDLVYGLLQKETKSYQKNIVNNYENERRCSTLKNAILNLNRTGYLKSDLVEKSWNDTFKSDCGNL